MGMSSNFSMGLPMEPNQPRMDIGMGYRDLIGQNPVADQTQQQIANPIYGQQSPFQPPTNIGGIPAEIGSFDPMPMPGMGGKGGFGGGMMPPGVRIGLPYEPYQPNPLEGTPAGGRGQLAGGPAGQPILGGGQPQPVPMMRNFPGYDFNGEPTPQPIHMMQNFTGGGVSGLPVSNARQVPVPQQPVSNARMVGGLKPAPRNYRPPMRGGNLRSYLKR